jgi:hypothetical protein
MPTGHRRYQQVFRGGFVPAAPACLANPATTTFSGAITGPGSLELDGGQLTLTGAGNNIGGNLDLCACDVGGITIKGGSFTVGGLTQSTAAPSPSRMAARSRPMLSALAAT